MAITREATGSRAVQAQQEPVAVVLDLVDPAGRAVAAPPSAGDTAR